MNPIELLPQSTPGPQPELSDCGRVCDEYIREARLIQSSLIPTASFRDRSIEIAFRFTPFFQVGGDFVDFFRLPNGLVGLYLGDVVGKGLAAAMYGALVMGTLRGIHKSDTSAADVLSLLNQRLWQRPLPGRFCATLYAIFDPASHTLVFSNAGLPFPLHASANQCAPIGAGGIPSGLLASATYDQYAIQLSPGDSVLFATDGLHESVNPEGVEFCSSPMQELWARCQLKSALESLDQLFDGLRRFSDGASPQDDITAIVLRVLP